MLVVDEVDVVPPPADPPGAVIVDVPGALMPPMPPLPVDAACSAVPGMLSRVGASRPDDTACSSRSLNALASFATAPTRSPCCHAWPAAAWNARACAAWTAAGPPDTPGGKPDAAPMPDDVVSVVLVVVARCGSMAGGRAVVGIRCGCTRLRVGGKKN